MLSPTRTTAPAAPVVTFDEANQWLHDAEDQRALVEGLIASATAHLDGWSGILGRCLVNQGWLAKFCEWPSCGILRLPFPDVSAATVKYFDADNVEQTVAGASVAVLSDELGSYVRFSDSYTFPTLYDDRGDAVQVTLTAGYGAAAEDVPPPIKTAILLTAAHWFEHREAVGDGSLKELPLGAYALVAPYRRIGV